MCLRVPNLPPRPRYPVEAEAPIIAALEERDGWINVTPVAVATTVLNALRDAGWRLMPAPRYRKDDDGEGPRDG